MVGIEGRNKSTKEESVRWKENINIFSPNNQAPKEPDPQHEGVWTVPKEVWWLGSRSPDRITN